MSIHWNILGRPGEDNAVLVRVDTGQSIHPLLFDCGEGCLPACRISEIQSIEHLCFSHFHMDHVSGFDTFFRHNYNRPGVPVQVWGPKQTVEVMHHRFRSFTWNLHHDQPGEWIVREIDNGLRKGARFHTAEAFSLAHALPESPVEENRIHQQKSFRIEALPLPHLSVFSLAYKVVEADRTNICPEALQRSGLSPGPWLRELTEPESGKTEPLSIDGRPVDREALRKDLLVSSPGESLAYLTDFRIEPGTKEWNAVTAWLAGTNTVLCECQYLNRDESLAIRNGHMTSGLVGELASRSGIGKLFLMHLSRRYSVDEWKEQRTEVRTVFPKAAFPDSWNL